MHMVAQAAPIVGKIIPATCLEFQMDNDTLGSKENILLFGFCLQSKYSWFYVFVPVNWVVLHHFFQNP